MATEDELSEQEQARRGQLLARVLMLKKKRDNGRWDTTWGDKTDLGLYRTVARIVHGENLPED